LATKPKRKEKNQDKQWVSIAALIVSVSSLSISGLSVYLNKRQSDTAASQLLLREEEARPYVRIIPRFETTSTGIHIRLIDENMNSVPAKIIFEQSNIGSDVRISDINLHSTPGAQDIIFQNKPAGGSMEFPTIPPMISQFLVSGSQKLRVVSCIIYSTISVKYKSRWESDGVYQYFPNSNLPYSLYVDDFRVDGSKSRCDPQAIYQNWKATQDIRGPNGYRR
jgi:hypothetical protein